SLPVNVHLLTLDQLSAKVFLLRVEHYFETDEDAVYSKSVEIELQSVFHVLGKITDLTELTLAANLPLADMKRLIWRTDRNESSYWKSTGLFEILSDDSGDVKSHANQNFPSYSGITC
ncbi:unnamed protein product, partial [Adineta ricciae]